MTYRIPRRSEERVKHGTQTQSRNRAGIVVENL
jgi:hypothetical protein